MKNLRLDDLDDGDKIKIFLKNGHQFLGRSQGIFKGKILGPKDKNYYLKIKTGNKIIKNIKTKDIFKMIKL